MASNVRVSRMDLTTVTYVVKVVGAVVAAIWTLIVLYDVAVADAPTRKVLTHALYAALSLGVVALVVLNPPE